MSRRHTGNLSVPRVSRRRALAIAAVGAGTSMAGIAGLSFARENAKSDKDNAPLVISLRDAESGTFDLFTGGSRIQIKDPGLAKRLVALAHRR